jgi:hypothetical protein
VVDAIALEIIAMFRPNFSSRGPARPSSRLLVDDLNAQLAPLNLYGLFGVGVAVVDGLILLAGGRSAGRRHEDRCAGH